ncbi:MAG: hypothetical protein AB7H86_01985 [Blastocatellales bacterium]
MKNMTGRPVFKDDFFDRSKDLAEIWRKLETENLLLLAPRRVGKTSLMYRLLNEIDSYEEISGMLISVPDVSDEKDFIERLYRGLLESPNGQTRLKRHWNSFKSSTIGRLFKNIESIGIKDVFEVAWREAREKDWVDLGGEFFDLLRQMDGRWVIMIDELPVFVLNLIKKDPSASRAKTFLYWLRGLRQMPPPHGEKLRFLIAGSIGLDTIASRYKMGDSINDLTVMSLGPFTVQTAHDFLETLGSEYSIPLSPEVRERIIEKAEWLIPYHLQLFFSGILELCSDERITPTRETVDQAFETLLSRGKAAYFDYWSQRLTEELGSPHDGWARSLLNAISKDANGVSRQNLQSILSKHISNPVERDETLNWLLEILIGDGYLVDDESDRLGFRSSLLREFWYRRYAK